MKTTIFIALCLSMGLVTAQYGSYPGQSQYGSYNPGSSVAPSTGVGQTNEIETGAGTVGERPDNRILGLLGGGNRGGGLFSNLLGGLLGGGGGGGGLFGGNRQPIAQPVPYPVPVPQYSAGGYPGGFGGYGGYPIYGGGYGGYGGGYPGGFYG